MPAHVHARAGGALKGEALSEENDDTVILGKAVLRAVEDLGMKDADLAVVIGVSPSSLSRIRLCGRGIVPGSKEGELALIFLQLYRSLSVLLGDSTRRRAWFHSENRHLGGVPAELVKKAAGLVHACQYLDAMQGKI